MSIRRAIIGLFAVISAFSTLLRAEDRPALGVTAQLQHYECVGENLAILRMEAGIQPLTIPSRPSIRDWSTLGIDEWLPLDSCFAWANIPPGDRYVIRLNLPGRCVEEVLPENDLTDYCMEAVARAPRWVRADLINNLNRITGEFGDEFREWNAASILEAEDPYVDEIAFAIAHISPNLLGDLAVPPELIVENVETIYAADEYLDYVRIVDHGEVGDDDYWTTLEYNIKTADDDTIQVEIDPEIYYWYVVHPRVTEEVPQFINPATGRSAQPPRGVFWRDFLLNHPDEGYPSLREVLEDCGVMWSNLFNDGSPDNGAVGIITNWIQTVLDFDCREERPNQPVRIYRLHMGRCGEHSDLVAAAARSALIPCICNMTFCNDHTWNEFWDGHWISWEPVNTFVGDSLHYENGWDWVFPAVWDWRSDGFVWTVTERYSEGVADLNVLITSRGHPVDGAKIMLASENNGGGFSPATWGYTNAEGRVSFKVGDDRTIYIRVESEVGSFPPQANTVTRIIANVRADAVYDWDHNFNRRIALVSPDDAEEPGNPTNHFHLNVNYELLSETVNGQIFRDSEFFAEIASGRLDFFICDEDNYRLYTEGEDFSAFSSGALTGDGEIQFTLPTDGAWYAVFSNENHLANYMLARIETRLYRDENVAVGDDLAGKVPVGYRLYQNYPNPFNSRTNIAFDIIKGGKTKVTIFDMTGRELFAMPLGVISSGQHILPLNAAMLNTGSYLYQVECGDFKAQKTMILIR
ncbi:hypothetical protein DRJ17_06365 [Candidatus Woesearchaeota archaeon]|nr:MAG: hypothetical protein DRJ17_06365 [Candidatus Woesearchaeota archaeon]